MSIEKLRVKLTINLFKRNLLNDFHVANKAQTNSLFAIFSEVNTCTVLTERTWQSWFSLETVVPKAVKLKELTKISRALNHVSDGLFASDNFETIALNQFAKIRSNSLAGSNSNCSLQLFLDAVELSAETNNVRDSSFSKQLVNAANAILEKIHTRWAPRHGSIYSKLPSRLKVVWDDADVELRGKIKQNYNKFKPNLFNYQYDSPNKPNAFLLRQLIDLPPQHVYKYLLSLSDDSDFLTGFILKVWTFDLAASAFAMNVIARADRHNTFGLAPSQEMLYWGAFQQLFINPSELDDQDEFLELALLDCSGSSDQAQIKLLNVATR